jgi:hypothetical protein
MLASIDMDELSHNDDAATANSFLRMKDYRRKPQLVKNSSRSEASLA